MDTRTLLNEPLDLKDLCQSLLKIHAFGMREKKLEMNFYYDDSLPKPLLEDNYRIHTILSHLLGNAVKFTEVGSITLKVEKVSEGKLKAKEEDEKEIVVRLTVIDTGKGISKD